MLRVGSAFLLLLLLSSLTACRSQTSEQPNPGPSSHSLAPATPTANTTATHAPAASPTAASDPQRDLDMYEAAIDTFFRDGQVQRLFQPDLLKHKVVYVEPSFSDTKKAIPDEVMQMITTHTTAQGLAQVQTEQIGGAVITLSSIGSDPGAATVYQQRGPTIQVSAWVSGIACGASVGIGYLLTANDAGWEAQQYLLVVC